MTVFKPGPADLIVMIQRGPSKGTAAQTTGEVRQRSRDYPDGMFVQVITGDRQVRWMHRDDLEIVGRAEPLLSVATVRDRVRQMSEVAA
jgi:hypothetical protein